MSTSIFCAKGQALKPKRDYKKAHSQIYIKFLKSLDNLDLINLIDYRFRATIDRNTSYEFAFEHLYWQATGKDYKTGEKSFLLQQFEKKYKIS